jgi:hypothetical protein
MHLIECGNSKANINLIWENIKEDVNRVNKTNFAIKLKVNNTLIVLHIIA